MMANDDAPPSDTPDEEESRYTGPPLVAVGASAGGLEAFEKLLGAAPPASGLAFVLLIHLDPSRESNLAEILDRRTPIAVKPIVSGTTPQPDTAYVIPSGKYASIRGGRLYLSNAPAGQTPKMVIDRFFRSMAKDLGSAAIGVVLSGTGTDGTLGVQAIHGEGGLAIAQSEESAAYPAMPSSAIATGDVDHILPIEAIVQKIVAYVRHPAFGDGGAFAPAADDLSTLLGLVQRATGHDFSQYKRATILRRITRRLQLLGLDNLRDYTEYVSTHAEEPELLFRDLLIRVTAFFRDPEAFEALRDLALPRLADARGDGAGIRVWVPGCATGEEAYSLAVLLFEYLSGRGERADFQVFATDVDPKALEIARRGVYPLSIGADVSPERLERFFVREGDTYRIVDVIRDRIVFAPQDMVSDPPFSSMDLISCRNLLIYLDTNLQARLLPLFHYALNPGGILFLGPSENVGEYGSLFSELHRRWRIFQRTPGTAAPRLRFPTGSWTRTEGTDAVAQPPAPGDQGAIGVFVTQKLLERFGPPTVLVDGKGQILHSYGRTGAYLELPAGQPTMNLYRMAKGTLEADLRTAIHRATRERRPVTTQTLEVPSNGSAAYCRVAVSPLEPSVFGDDLLLVSFEPAEPPREAQAVEPGSQAEVEQLRTELKTTKEYLQSTIEELETSNEELASSNEELLSMNQEFQSTNEELETSKEEIQSVNEELSTVNTELKNKVDELAAANADIKNLHESTGVATLFVDRSLQIRSFTPAIKNLFGVTATDRGRPLSDLAQKFDFPDLSAALGRVLETEESTETEVAAGDRWYVMRLLPYHAADESVSGVILTFVDVTSLKQAQAETEAREARLGAVLDTAVDAIITIDPRGTVQWFNKAAERMFGYTADEVVGRNVKMLMPSPYHEEHDGYLTRYLRTGEKRIIGFRREVTARRKDGSTFPINLGVAEVRFENQLMFTGLIQDLTERRNLEEELRQAQKMEAVGTLASGVAHDFNNLLMGIIGCADIAKSRLPAGHPALHYVDEIQKSSKSGAAIVSQLMTFSRRRRPETITLDLNQVLADTQEMLRRLIGEDVRLEIRPTTEPLFVRCDPGQVEQILMNLSANARHAMPGGGTLRISTGQAQLTRGQLGQSKASPGRFAFLSIEDTGFGMDDETKRRIFEPFFTTKGPGHGTGLGLSTVYGIVQQNNGHIDVDSRPGAGTTFCVYLPNAEAPVEQARLSPQPPSARHDQETILLVEDETLVREAARHYLEVAGYRVVTASDGVSALDVLSTPEAAIDLMVTDVVMPDLGGGEVARQAQAIRPGLPVLFVSAHPNELLHERHLLDPGAPTLQKPVDRDQLLEAVRAKLDEGSARKAEGAAPARPREATSALGSRSPGSASGASAAAADSAQPRASAGKRTALLLVEDERLARMATRELLSELDFDVYEAENAAAARRLFETHQDKIKAVVTDVRLPDASGPDLAEELRGQKASLAVVFTSGLSEKDPQVERALGAPRTRFVAKPVEVSALADVIRRALE